MIQVEGLTKKFGDFYAVRDASFDVQKGEIMGFLGPNAAGKTTTMRILTCFFPASGGKASVGGFDVFKDSIEVRKRIGYLPESAPLYTDMPVRSYLHFVAEVKGVSRGDRSKQVNEAIHDAGLEGVEARLIGHLSKGYKQRVGIAQALVSDPEVLILDEPTVGLDPRQIQEIRALIKKMGGRRTIILSTHILPEVSMVCERVTIINKGRVIAQDTPDNLTRQVQQSSLTILHVDGPKEEVRSALAQVPGVSGVIVQSGEDGRISSFTVESKRDHDIRRELASAIVRKNWGLLELRRQDVSLEDAFIKLVTKE